MVLISLLFSLVIACIFTAIFAAGFRKHKTVPVLLGFLIILFLATCAVGIWMTPVGPLLFGVSWLPFLIVGLLVALLLTAIIAPARPPHSDKEAAQERRVAVEMIAAFDLFFWILAIGLCIVIVVRFFVR